MRVDELLKQYEEAKKIKRNWDFKKLIKRTYMPYSEKQSMARSIVNASSYRNIDGKQVYIRDTSNMLFIFSMKLIEGYTELEITAENVIGDYDLLMESGVMKQIMNEIPQSEVEMLQGMVDMTRDDLEYNTRSLTAFLETKFDALQLSFDIFKKVLENPNVQAKIAEFTN